MSAQVAIARCGDYNQAHVDAAIEEVLGKLGGIKAFVRPGQRVLLKPNLLVGKPQERGVCTHPAVLEAIAVRVLDAGARPFIGDSPSIGSAQSVARKCGILQVAQRLGVEVVNFDQPQEASHPYSPRYKTIVLARQALEADAVISLSRVKTHGLMKMTMAVKNLFGCVVGMHKSQWHLRAAHHIEAFTEMLLYVYKIVNPVLNIADGIMAMEGNGPTAGDLKPLGVILASPDAVALDRVIGEIVGLPVEHNLTARLGSELQLGEGELENIALLGQPLSELAVKDFKFPFRGRPRDQRLPGPLKSLLGDSAIIRPEIDHWLCTRCGTCAKACPAKAISMRKRGEEEFMIIDRRACIHCFCCQEVCPENAIRVRSGLLARLLFR